MIKEYGSEYEHDLLNGRYCIECGTELDGDIPMHLRFCVDCGQEHEVLDEFKTCTVSDHDMIKMAFISYGDY